MLGSTFIKRAFTLIITIFVQRFRFGSGHTTTIENPVASSTPPAKKFKRKALLIGIEYHYELEEYTKRAHSDVLSMRQLLIDRYHYDPHDIVTLIDNNKPDQEQPTRDNMIQKMNDLINGARQGDRFFFYFAGDAIQEESNDVGEEDGMDELIVTCDKETIRDNELFERLARPLPIGSTLVTIFDCSHSGSLFDLMHFRCNSVYVPWVNKRRRRTGTLHSGVRKNAQLDVSPWSPTIMAPIPSYFAALPSSTEWYGTPGFPIIRSDSPGSVYCDGRCREAAILQHDVELDADIICLSSAKEDQLDYGGGRLRSMTQILIEILQKNPNPTLKTLLTVISHGLHADSLLYMDDFFRMYKKQVKDTNRRSERGKKPFESRYVGIDSFQEPQISSPLPLDMSRQWQL